MAQQTTVKGPKAKCIIKWDGVEWHVEVWRFEEGTYARHEPSDYYTDETDDAFATACIIAGIDED